MGSRWPAGRGRRCLAGTGYDPAWTQWPDLTQQQRRAAEQAEALDDKWDEFYLPFEQDGRTDDRFVLMSTLVHRLTNVRVPFCIKA